MGTAVTERRELDRVAILFSGDSGDGMQLTGSQFTNTSAVFGNDVSTFPDFPSEIRAPAGSVAGVSAFQLNFSSRHIHTPGDQCQALVAMNPAALKVHLPRLEDGGVLVVNEDAFTAGGLKKAGYTDNPLEDEDLDARYQVHRVPITNLTVNCLQDVKVDSKSKQRCKNFFALGLLYWLFDRPVDTTLGWIDGKFSRRPEMAEANRLALQAGYNYGENTDAFAVRYTVSRAETEPGTYRLINGNDALALGAVAAAHLAGKPMVYCSYPITPASEILQAMARYKHLDVRPVQLEDEIAAMGAAIGAAFGGAFSMTGTSGPGLCLKSEALGLAIMLEIPLVVVDVQRGGPSTGLPTKTEQGDLLQSLLGRNGESPMPILAASSAADCFDVAIEAFRVAVRHSTPVMVLSEGCLAFGAGPWRIPNFDDLEPITVEHRTDPEGFQPYMRDESTLGRPWVIPGTPGLEHRIGGLEKEHVTGNVSYDPDNHEFMCRLRQEKVDRVAEFIPEIEVDGPDSGKLLVLTWGSVYGVAVSAVDRCRENGREVAHVHLRYLNPFPKDLGDVLSRYDTVLIPELNLGHLAHLIRAKYLIPTVSLSKVKGRPFAITEVEDKIEELLS